MKPLEFTDGNFEQEVMKSEIPVLIDFWAVWCGPCRLIAPFVEELAVEYAGKVKIGKLDVDNNPDVAMKYGIRSIPTLLVFKKGEVVDRIVGAASKPKIAEKLDAVLTV
jgi:thioredoxin 1